MIPGRRAYISRVIIRSGSNYHWLFFSLVAFTVAGGTIQHHGPAIISIPGIVAGCILFGLRRYFVINARKQSVECWWRFFDFIPFIRLKRWPLSDFTAVHLRVEYRTDGDGDSSKVHLVKLKGKTSLLLTEASGYMHSRKLGERLSQLTQLPLSDKISGIVSIRRPDEIHLTLRERLQRLEEPPIMPEFPPNGIMKVNNAGGVTILTLSPQPTTRFTIVASQILCGIFVVIGILLIRHGNGAGWVFGGMGLFTALFFLASGIASRFPLTITISRDAIRFKQTSLFKKEMKIEALHEIVLGPEGLFLLGRKKCVIAPYEFKDKKEKEVGAYIRDLICHIVFTVR